MFYLIHILRLTAIIDIMKLFFRELLTIILPLLFLGVACNPTGSLCSRQSEWNKLISE